MEKIKKYVERFFKNNAKNRNYALSTGEVIAFANELQDTNKLFYTILALFNYGYAKGYRAALAEMKKKGHKGIG